jgi:uncharacterized protein YdbL (DUF1318 family)
MRTNGILSVALLLAVSLATAHAADIDMKVSTPAIEKLKAALTGHLEQLAAFKTNGAVGEGRDGFLAVRDLESAGLSLLQKKQAREWVAAANADRKNLYREILLANNLPADNEEKVKQVMSAAAHERRSAAAPNDWVQDPNNGGWVQAKDLR